MPEALVAALDELTVAWQDAMADPAFVAEFDAILREYAGVPSLLYDAERLSEQVGARILLKREDLNHTGAHKIRNVLGQALLTRRMGKTRVIAETGAGQHGVASATAAAYFGLDCTVYMGAVDTERQALNVARMHLLGAKVVPVDSGSATLKDAINEALRDWVASVDHTAYLFGTAAGPHPFPSMVRDFTRGIGDEARAQCLEQYGALPDADRRLRRRRLQRDRAVHRRSSTTTTSRSTASRPAATASRPAGTPPRSRAGESGVLHGARTYVLQDEDGQTIESHSISAGLDYPGVGPQHAHLRATGRATYLPVTDAEAMEAFALLPAPRASSPRSSRRTPSPARSTWRASWPPRRARRTMLINLSGRGDKDMGTAIEWFGLGDPDTDDRDERRDRLRRRPAPTAAPRWSATCPPASPTSTAAIEAMRAMVDAGCDVIEVGLPYSDPVMDGPTIQAAAQQALDGGVRTTRRAAHRRGGRRDRRAHPGDDLLEPRRALRRRAVRRRPRRRRGRGPDHARPDARQRRRVDRRRRRPRPRQGVPRRAVLDRRPDRDDHRRLPRLRLRHRRHGRDRRPGQRPATSPGRWWRAPRRPPTSRSGSASVSATATRPPRWRRTPTA